MINITWKTNIVRNALLTLIGPRSLIKRMRNGIRFVKIFNPAWKRKFPMASLMIYSSVVILVAFSSATFARDNTNNQPGVWKGEISFWGWPDEVKNARDALTLFYLNKRVYLSVECMPKQVKSYIFIRCSPVLGKVPGGIYVITNSFNTVSILPLNGKAQTHMQDRVVVRDVNSRPIEILSTSNPDVLKARIAAPLAAAFDAFGL